METTVTKKIKTPLAKEQTAKNGELFMANTPWVRDLISREPLTSNGFSSLHMQEGMVQEICRLFVERNDDSVPVQSFLERLMVEAFRNLVKKGQTNVKTTLTKEQMVKNGELYVANIPWLRGRIAKKLHLVGRFSPQMAEDMVQEVCRMFLERNDGNAPTHSYLECLRMEAFRNQTRKGRIFKEDSLDGMGEEIGYEPVAAAWTPERIESSVRMAQVVARAPERLRQAILAILAGEDMCVAAASIQASPQRLTQMLAGLGKTLSI